MNKKIQIEEFLNELGKLYKQNPRLQISSDTIYHYLATYGLTEDEKNNCDINYMFSHWIKKYYNSQYLNVYRDERQPFFLQFANYNDVKTCEMIKIYMSFSREDMEKCVDLIFDFIDQNNIKSASKVSQCLRSDSVVLRLFGKEEAIKVLNFINNNGYICKCAKKTNPFSMKAGVCGVGYDDKISYNSCISKIISEYLKYLRESNQLDNITSEHFFKFVYNFYQNTFINCSQLLQFINCDEFQRYVNKHKEIGQVIVNWKQVCETFISHLYHQNAIDKYFELYDCFVKQVNLNELAQQYTNKIVVKNNTLNNLEINKGKIINEYINYGISNFGNDKIICQLNRFIDTGNYKLITRTNGLREKFQEYNITGFDVVNLTNNNLQNYIINFNKNVSSDETTKTNNSMVDTYMLFSNSCFATYQKYGKEQLFQAILHSFEREYNFFTNREYRDQLSKNIDKEQVILLCQKLLFNLGYKGIVTSKEHLAHILSEEIEKYVLDSQKQVTNNK